MPLNSIFGVTAYSGAI